MSASQIQHIFNSSISPTFCTYFSILCLFHTLGGDEQKKKKKKKNTISIAAIFIIINSLQDFLAVAILTNKLWKIFSCWWRCYIKNELPLGEEQINGNKSSRILPHYLGWPYSWTSYIRVREYYHITRGDHIRELGTYEFANITTLLGVTIFAN